MSLPNPGPIQGALIRAVDFNDIQKAVSRILNDKIADYPSDSTRATYGYGQTNLSSPVTRIVDEAEAAHIARLKIDLLKIATHCGIQSNPIITGLPTVSQGGIIYAAHLDAYVDAVNLLIDNRFSLGAGQYSDETLAPDLTNSRITPWGNNSNYKGVYGSSVVRHDFTLDFGSAANARYFFNSGSSIRLTASRSGGSTSFQNTSWSNALSAMQTVIFNYNSCSATTGSGASKGYYQLTTNAQQVFTLGADTSYTSYYAVNQYYITMSCNCTGVDNSLGTASQIYVKVYFEDGHQARPINNYFADVVDGTLTSRVSIRRATGSNVEVFAPTGINTRLLINNS